MKKNIILTVIISLLSTTILFAQNGTRLIGFDAVTTGRGGTATGFFDNPSLMMNNPAGLAFLKSSQFDLSISLMAPTVNFANTINNTKGKDNLFPLGCVSYVHKPTGKITYGFGIFTQGGMGADFNLNHALYRNESGGYVKQPYHSKFAVMQGGGSVAYKFNEQFSAGITADVVYGQVEFEMPMSLPPSMLKGITDPQTGATFGDLFSAPPASGGLGYTEVVASANMSKLKAFGLNGKIGLAYKPTESFSVGLNYSLPVNLTYKNGTAAMDMTYQMNDAFGKIVAGIIQQNPGTTEQQAQQMAMTMFSQLGIDLSKGVKDVFNAEAEFGLPQSLSAGIFYAPAKKIRLALDAEWINWAKAFKQMDISLKDGTNPNINRMLNVQGAFNMLFPMYWENTVVIRSGAEYDATNNLVIRGGYVYGSNPVPATTVFPVFPAVVKHHVTLGGSVKMSKAIAINVAYEHAFKNDVTATPNSFVANEYDNSTSGLKNDIFHVSLSWLLK